MEHNTHRERFRRFSQSSSLSNHERVRFTYMYEDTQQEFVKALTKGKQRGLEDGPLRVCIV